MQHMTCSMEGNVAVLVLTNPPSNRVSAQLIDDLEEALTIIDARGARALLLRAEGPNFSLGGDLTTWPEMDVLELRSMFGRFPNAFNRFERLPIPTVAAVQGGASAAASSSR